MSRPSSRCGVRRRAACRADVLRRVLAAGVELQRQRRGSERPRPGSRCARDDRRARGREGDLDQPPGSRCATDVADRCGPDAAAGRLSRRSPPADACGRELRAGVPGTHEGHDPVRRQPRDQPGERLRRRRSDPADVERADADQGAAAGPGARDRGRQSGPGPQPGARQRFGADHELGAVDLDARRAAQPGCRPGAEPRQHDERDRAADDGGRDVRDRRAADVLGDRRA